VLNVSTIGSCFYGTILSRLLSFHSRVSWDYVTRQNLVRRSWISSGKDWPNICLKVKIRAKLQGYCLGYQCLSVRGCENRCVRVWLIRMQKSVYFLHRIRNSFPANSLIVFRYPLLKHNVCRQLNNLNCIF
jgi:hypothetical protein